MLRILPGSFSFKHLRLTIVCVCAFLAGLQFYALNFDSWVADHYRDRHAENLTREMGELAQSGSSVFFYQAPEAVLFFKSSNYFQYFAVNEVVGVGESSFARIQSGEPDFIVIKGEGWREDELFKRYELVRTADKFYLLKKRV